jgi:hypothetical protein
MTNSLFRNELGAQHQVGHCGLEPIGENLGKRIFQDPKNAEIQSSPPNKPKTGN